MFSVSHKTIGISYLFVAFVCGFVGFIYSLFLRVEISCYGFNILFGDYQLYNVIISAHGLVMIFGYIMPVLLGGYMNYWLPVMIGVPDMMFARINNMSF